MMGGYGEMIGAGISATASHINAHLQNYFSAKSASKAYERSMYSSSTAHQREVDDLRKAGLNPILSATGGMGSPSVSAPMAPQTGEFFNPASAMAGARLVQELKNMKESQRNIEEDSDLKRAQRIYTNRLDNIGIGLEKKAYWDAETSKYESQIYGSTAKGARIEGEIDETKYGESVRYLDRMIKSLRGTSGAVRDYRGLRR